MPQAPPIVGLIVFEGLVGRNYVGVRPCMLCSQRVLDDLSTLILEYSRTGNVVPMVVTVDHEFHRLVDDFPDLVHHVLGSHRINRVSDDHAVACHHDHGAVNPRSKAVNVIGNLGQIELGCRRLCSRHRDRQCERRRNACAGDHAVYRLSHSCLHVLTPWDVHSSRRPNAFFPKRPPQSTAEVTLPPIPNDPRTSPIRTLGDYFPFTLSVIGTLSIRLRDLTMSFVVSAYFLKCGVSK